MRVAHKGVVSEHLSDEEHDVLRAPADAPVFPPQDRGVDPHPDHGWPTCEYLPMTHPSDAPHHPIRVRETEAALHHPEGNLS